MENTIYRFKDLPPGLHAAAGGKGGMLSRMYRSGYPVPDGFVILPAAFQGGKLSPEAWKRIADLLAALRKHEADATFAVRSSALSEDSAQASFAGEFETVLDVQTDGQIRDAIYTVYGSSESERVKAYSSAHGMDALPHQVAVVVQRMVPSELAGVLFSADPVTGDLSRMTGNFVHGFGEQLVSGEADAYPFTFARPKGIYEGPREFKPYAAKLYSLAARLEKEFGGAQDIEWAVAKGSLYILQARPITTLKPGNPDTYEWNDSFTGDFLWTNTNVGEAMAGVFTPLSWSIIRKLDEEQYIIPGYYLFSGNICGRMYTNLSMGLSLYPAFGKPVGPLVKRMGDVFGQMPENMTIPIYPFTKLGVLRTMLPRILYRLQRLNEAFKTMPEHLKETPEWCKRMPSHIQQAATKEALLSLWHRELEPYNLKALWAALAGGRKAVVAYKLKEELTKLIGTEDMNALMSNFRGSSSLESLGPILGISRILKGEMRREEYRQRYGHRGPHEFELSVPHPGEEPAWLETQLEEFRKNGTDVEDLLGKQRSRYEEAWNRLEKEYPGKAKGMAKKLAKVAQNARLREAVRSEWTRVFRVNRAFAVRAGELTGIGDDVFFLYMDEVLRLLAGDDSAVRHIPARQETYRKYKALPAFPAVIRGRFDPFRWAEDPNRRADYYDPALPISASESETLRGFAGAAGRIEGIVRVLADPEDGAQLQPGEILVASTTNVGWTPLFPRAAAIITDIGAPLSHAAIVARELGIPAVVGCGSATTRLRTGDRVIVDGGQGVVHLLNRE